MSLSEGTTARKNTPDVYKGFEGQRTPSEDDYLSALFGALIVVDANVLLDLYRYNETGRQSLLSTFRAFEDRLWVPHQAMHEFWNNRADVLRDPQGTRGLMSSLDKTEETAVQAINTWAKHSAQSDTVRDEVAAYIRKGFKNARGQVQARSDDSFRDWLKDTNTDPVLHELEVLLQGKVGAPFSADEHTAHVDEALKRIESNEPPGYKDNHKSDPKAAGDYLIWAQTLIEASTRKLDVLFVTRDLKEDWVRRKDDELSGPRSELVQEMLSATGHKFLLRSPVGILELARNNLSIEVSDESLADARRLNDTEQSFPEIVNRYNWIRNRSGWDVASAQNLLDALQAGSPVLSEVLERLATTEEILDEGVATELGDLGFEQFRSDLDLAIEALQAERLISHTVSSPLLPVIRRSAEGGEIGLQGYRLREEFRELIQAIIERSDDFFLWQYLDDDRITTDSYVQHIHALRDRPSSGSKD